jgi:hypothetical protein
MGDFHIKYDKGLQAASSKFRGEYNKGFSYITHNEFSKGFRYPITQHLS